MPRISEILGIRVHTRSKRDSMHICSFASRITDEICRNAFGTSCIQIDFEHTYIRADILAFAFNTQYKFIHTYEKKSSYVNCYSQTRARYFAVKRKKCRFLACVCCQSRFFIFTYICYTSREVSTMLDELVYEISCCKYEITSNVQSFYTRYL